MNSIKFAVLGALALAVAAGLGACGQSGPDAVSAFQGRIDDWTREILADSPELAAAAGLAGQAGETESLDRLDDRSALAVDIRRTAAIRRLAELRALDRTRLNDADRITYAVLEEQFEAAGAGADFQFGQFSPLGGIGPYVLNPLDSAFLTLPDFMDRRHPIANRGDIDTYLTRLGQVGAAIDAETERARADAELGVSPPGFIIDSTIAALVASSSQAPAQRDYVTSLRVKLDALAEAATDADARAALQTRAAQALGDAENIVRTQIIPAEQRAAALLRGLRAGARDEPGVSNLPRGAEFYRAALRIATTTELTPDQIHRIGLDRVRAVEAQLDIALRRVGMTEGSVGARLSQLTADPRHRYAETEEGRAQLLADINARVARVTEMAPNWFGRLPRSPLEVRRVPAAAEASAPGAYYSPPSIDGTQPGVYFINLRDLSEMTRIDVPTQDFHEAVPGHHFQVALAQEQEDIPLLRRLVTFDAFSEGWGLYAEELADEQGLHESDPIGRIGFLRWQLWRAARLVVDTGLHAKNWSRDHAITYMQDTTGDAPGIVATEVDRYVVWPGQACSYEIGRREIMRLREEARSRLGPDFDLKGFHDAVLVQGELPLSVLDAQVRAWIPQQAEAAERARRRAGQ